MLIIILPSLSSLPGTEKYNVIHSKQSNQWIVRKLYEPTTQVFRKYSRSFNGGLIRISGLETISSTSILHWTYQPTLPPRQSQTKTTWWHNMHHVFHKKMQVINLVSETDKQELWSTMFTEHKDRSVWGLLFKSFKLFMLFYITFLTSFFVFICLFVMVLVIILSHLVS